MSDLFKMSKTYWKDAQTGKQMQHDPTDSVYVQTPIIPVLLWSCCKVVSWFNKFSWAAPSPAFHTPE